MNSSINTEVPDRVFERAAEMFSLLSTPTRLRILRGGALARRRAGAQVFYRIVSAQAPILCESICAERRLRVPPSRLAHGPA